MFKALEEIIERPAAFSHYTAAQLWTDEHTSKQMLAFHLNGAVDVSSRRTEFIDRSVAWITERFELGEGKAVADFGCGPGLYASRLAASGADVTGIDFSPRSIRYAKEQAQQLGLAIDYQQGNYLDYESDKRFDLISMIMCDFCALSPAQRKTMLEKFQRHMKPGGAVLLDVYSLVAFAAKQESFTFERDMLNGFWSDEPYFGFLSSFKYEAEKVSLDKYTIVEEDRTRTVSNWLQHFDPESLKREMESAGLAVQEVLGNVAGGAYDPSATEFAVIAGR